MSLIVDSLKNWDILCVCSAVNPSIIWNEMGWLTPYSQIVKYHIRAKAWRWSRFWSPYYTYLRSPAQQYVTLYTKKNKKPNMTHLAFQFFGILTYPFCMNVKSILHITCPLFSSLCPTPVLCGTCTIYNNDWDEWANYSCQLFISPDQNATIIIYL